MALVHAIFMTPSENHFEMHDSKLESIQKKPGQMDIVEPEIPSVRHFGP